MRNISKMNVGFAAFILGMGVTTTSLAACSQKQPAEQAPVVSTPGQPVDLTYAAEKAVNSVVYIKVTQNGRTETVEVRDPFEDFFGDFFGRGGGGTQRRQIQTPKRQASGSGVIISKDGYIVTNNHVVEGADELNVKLNDNREFKARIIGLDKATDLALIKIEGDNFPAITVGSSEALKLGEWVLAVGNPFNLTSTVTAGIVSAKARSLHANDIEAFIQTDAAINQGNSGGALVNTRGELVGINAMLYSQTGSYSGYGFAIPTAIMTKVVADLKEFGTVQRAVLGIAGLDVSNYLDIEKEKGNEVDLGTVDGVYISEVSSDGAAKEAGFEKGDVVIAVEGKSIAKMAEMQERLNKHRPGDVVEITLLRDKKKITKKVTLRNAQGTTSVVKEVDLNDMGVALQPVSAQLKKELNLPYGLEVTALKRGKMMEAGITKGLIILKVNDREMHSKNDFDEEVRKANMSRDRVLWIQAKTKSGIYKAFTVVLEEPKGKK